MVVNRPVLLALVASVLGSAGCAGSLDETHGLCTSGDDGLAHADAALCTPNTPPTCNLPLGRALIATGDALHDVIPAGAGHTTSTGAAER